MTIIEITRRAKCKDCRYIESKTFGRAKRHICTNKESDRYDPNPYLSRVALRDIVCENWKL